MTTKAKTKKPSKASKKDEAYHVPDTAPAPEIDPQELPTFTAVTMHKMEGMGNAGWVVLKMTIQGDKVLSVVSSEPNLRAIAIEQLKIDTVKLFFNPLA